MDDKIHSSYRVMCAMCRESLQAVHRMGGACEALHRDHCITTRSVSCHLSSRISGLLLLLLHRRRLLLVEGWQPRLRGLRDATLSCHRRGGQASNPDLHAARRRAQAQRRHILQRSGVKGVGSACALH